MTLRGCAAVIDAAEAAGIVSSGFVVRLTSTGSGLTAGVRTVETSSDGLALTSTGAGAIPGHVAGFSLTLTSAVGSSARAVASFSTAYVGRMGLAGSIFGKYSR